MQQQRDERPAAAPEDTPEERPAHEGRHRKTTWLTVAAVLVVLITVAVTAQFPVGGRLLRRAGLVGPPQYYTELFFVDPNQLPTRVPSGHVALTVPFQIRNASAETSTYHWTVDFASAGRRAQVAAGDIAVPSGGTVTRYVPVAGLCLSRELEVFVNLPANRESIDFRTVCGA